MELSSSIKISPLLRKITSKRDCKFRKVCLNDNFVML